MDRVANISAWAWIFILEGAITIIAGILSFWIIQDFPEHAKFLSDKESKLISPKLTGYVLLKGTTFLIFHRINGGSSTSR